MKIILGDNQFFGINHRDLNKGKNISKNFSKISDIVEFIKKSLKIGLDGFMINSNVIGYKLINFFSDSNKEVHYSIPYPHKYANIVNEKGMLSLIFYFMRNTSLIKILKCTPKFALTRNLKYLIPIATSLEIPKTMPAGSTIYLQNIVTDLILGLERIDLLEYLFLDLKRQGYRLGIITLNPLILNSFIEKSNILNNKDVVVCFNININGFNVFPTKTEVEKFIKIKKKYKLMAMSIFSSGGSDVEESINYIKKLNLDYVVFGSSQIKNIQSNFELFHK